MARRPKKQDEGGRAAPFVEQGKRPALGPRTTLVEVDAVKLVVLDEDHSVWPTSLDRGEFKLPRPVTVWIDAIVRLRPPLGHDQAAVEKVRAALLAAGAARIKVETRRGTVIPTEILERTTPQITSIAQVVRQLVSEANCNDREALSALVEATMAKHGL
jgi:hypothetical protein